MGSASLEKTILETKAAINKFNPEIKTRYKCSKQIISEDRERIEEAEQKATDVTTDVTEDAVVTAQEETPDAKGIPEVTYTFDLI